MRAEIVAVGTELLMGQIVNTNAQYISKQLVELGIDCYFQTVVGDNLARIFEALKTAKGRADLVICTGGLGPTQDDITKEVLAQFVDQSIRIDETSLNKIKAFFEARNITMVASNERQAILIENSDPLPNDVGLAVGLKMKHDNTFYVVLPGPPREMVPMFQNYVKPWLLEENGEQVQIYSRMLKFAGIGESTLEHQLLDLINHQQDPTIAPYAKEGEVTIRVSTKAGNEKDAWDLIEPVVQQIRQRAGSYLYAEEDITLEEAIVKLMLEKKLTLSVAESCTGGLLSKAITDISGSSDMFKGGIVCYSNSLKHQLLQVPLEVLEGEHAPGAVSEQTALLLAENMRLQSNSHYAISITGVAGPHHSERKSVGLVYIGIAEKHGQTRVERLQLSGNRQMIRLRAMKSALYYLWRMLDRLPSQS